MRLRACLAGMLLCATACAEIPERVRIDVDGRSIEVRQRGLRPGGGWSYSPACGDEVRLDLNALGESLISIRMIGPDELEATGSDGAVIRLYRCAL